MSEMGIQELEMIKEICHTILHRMSLWQYLFYSKPFVKQYDEACEEIAKIIHLKENGRRIEP